ncbi:hypothetical protein [Amycolatopsis magusensis]|uniref:Uncharacterized protein n=1 Tax=Amycolatopsis magusensis TaxID=882444 RepID=A0ABS4PY84_9PSEU|nr:hypothetical protein [Amycolatopsis magusensis]MBP2183845.1 hypothetical protein [Amycolatopsis magusensis]
MVASTAVAPDSGDDDVQRISPVEAKLRASRIKPMTFGQFKAIRAEALTIGLPAEVATTLPWYAADPQAMVSALRAAPSHKELVARGTSGLLVQQDVLTWMIQRSLENMRAEPFRYTGRYALDRYSTLEDGSALRMDLTGHASPAEAFAHIAQQLDVVDAHIDANSPYGEDIRRNGVRRGGVLFPLVLDLPGGTRIGGYESADSYSRTMYAQKFNGITSSQVLTSWMTFPPATAKEFNRHPMKELRDKVLATAAAVREGRPVSDDDVEFMLRSVMPKSTVVLKADPDATDVDLDEVRRKLVSEQHLDRQLDFTEDTRHETRAEAVIGELTRRNMLPAGAGFTQEDILTMLETPSAALQWRGTHRDDVMVAAAAVFLPTPRSREDRLIPRAVASRGVIEPGNSKSGRLRSDLATQVVMRSINLGIPDRSMRKSAMERALRHRGVRGAQLDSRPVPELLATALAELAAIDHGRRRGESLPWGAAIRQLVLRGGFYLFFGPEMIIGRSGLGGKKGEDNRESTQIIDALAATPAGLQQLAQAIFDGRNGVSVRKIPIDCTAQDITTEPAEGDRLDAAGLRDWLAGVTKAAEKARLGEADSALARVSQDSEHAAKLVDKLENLVEKIASHTDMVPGDDGKPQPAGPPHVNTYGVRDTKNLHSRLAELSRRFEMWNMRFDVHAGTDEHSEAAQ